MMLEWMNGIDFHKTGFWQLAWTVERMEDTKFVELVVEEPRHLPKTGAKTGF